MAVLKLQLYSNELFSRTEVIVVLPTPSEGDFIEETPNKLHYPAPGEKFQVLWLLHGICNNADTWLYNTDIAGLAEFNRLAVVIPSCGNSFYHDLPYGHAYERFLTLELPEAVCSLLPLSPRRADNFICGFSMGGYGAFHLALAHPERYCAAVSMSGAYLDMSEHIGKPVPEEEPFPTSKWLRAVYGDGCKGFVPERDDVLEQLEQLKCKKAEIPALYLCCGTEDELLKNNRSLYQAIRKMDVPIEYRESPGIHRWSYWNGCLPQVLEWLPLKHDYILASETQPEGASDKL